MSNVYVVAADFMFKLAKIDQLDLLCIEGNKIIITDMVYMELEVAACLQSPAAIKAKAWLDNNRNEPWLEYKVKTSGSAA